MALSSDCESDVIAYGNSRDVAGGASACNVRVLGERAHVEYTDFGVIKFVFICQ